MGRPKGSLNKVTRAFKESVMLVYSRMGEHQGISGDDAFLLWARDNQSNFYQIASKIIPHEVVGPGQDGAHLVKTITHIHETVEGKPVE